MQYLVKLINQKTRGRSNIIAVDWSQRSMNICINRVAANAHVVAQEFFWFFILLLSYTKTEFDEMHRFTAIGHSFGAQIVGATGFRIGKQFARRWGAVIALDPSDQCFGRNQVRAFGGLIEDR